jgi:hypothetical protein
MIKIEAFRKDDDMVYIDFFQKDEIYIVIRMTETRNNILGISFANEKSGKKSKRKGERATMDLIPWTFPKYQNRIIPSAELELKATGLLNQAIRAFTWFQGRIPLEDNSFLRGDYQVAAIYYVPAEDGSNQAYEKLIFRLLAHHSNEREFLNYDEDGLVPTFRQFYTNRNNKSFFQ